MNYKFHIVDVFGQKQFQGNQLAVVRNTQSLLDKQMQQIAREINFSETTFIESDEKKDDNTYKVRIFTPKEEIPFAGHPTLGTAYIIQNEIIKDKVKAVTLEYKVGKIPVAFSYSNNVTTNIWMRQNEPEFYAEYTADEISKLLQISGSDIDERFPIQEVSTGMNHMMIPLKSLSGVKKAKINHEMLGKICKKSIAKGFMVFSTETYAKENSINARVFVDLLGIPEDPATGSAAGCLTGYLVKYNYFNSQKIAVNIEQGYEINRPSLIKIKSEYKNDSYNIEVGGQVFSFANGIIRVD